MNLQSLTKEQLLAELHLAVENYHLLLNNRDIYELRGTPGFILVKRRLNELVNEVDRRKGRSLTFPLLN